MCVCVGEAGRGGRRRHGDGGGVFGGVVCAFCVWLPCLPVITPCNLAAKGWP